MTELPENPSSQRSVTKSGNRNALANWGLLLGPLLAVASFWGCRLLEVETSAAATAGLVVLMAFWWMTEAIPLPATALLPLVLFTFFPVFPDQPRPGEWVQVELGSSETKSEKIAVAKLRSIESGNATLEFRNPLGDPVESVVSVEALKRLKSKGRFQQAAEPFANKFIYLYLGGFLVALSIERWNLHRRIALVTLWVFGTRPSMVVAGFMSATAGLSMWISNTATTVMMLPIAMSVVALLRVKFDSTSPPLSKGQMAPAQENSESVPRDEANTKQVNQFATCLMLAIAYAASLGGVATLVGTPPNAFLASFLEEKGLSISFASWMAFALPISLFFLVLVWLVLTRIVFRFKLPEIPEGRQFIHDELKKLGSMSNGERVTLAVFSLVALLWIGRVPLTHWDWLTEAAPWILQLSDPVIAMAGGLALFAIPVRLKPIQMAMNWESTKRLPWGVLLLFGGGLSLANAVQASGLGQVIGDVVASNTQLSLIGLIVLTTVVVVFLTEFTSNLATASLFLPILFQVALQIQQQTGEAFPPEYLLIPATLAASFAFMLPVATPPNAIVFGSEQVTVGQMAKAGILLNVLACILLPLLVLLLAPRVLGF